MTTPTKGLDHARNGHLDLRGLSATERDARVNVEIARLAGISPEYREQYAEPWGYFTGEVFQVTTGQVKVFKPLPPYATSCDAVMPLLEKHAFRFEGGKAMGCQYGVVICGSDLFTEWNKGGWYRGIHETFPLAACYALLRANGWEIFQ